jgi:hypothetical protein
VGCVWVRRVAFVGPVLVGFNLWNDWEGFIGVVGWLSLGLPAGSSGQPNLVDR